MRRGLDGLQIRIPHNYEKAPIHWTGCNSIFPSCTCVETGDAQKKKCVETGKNNSRIKK
jgi:hypothetical protein